MAGMQINRRSFIRLALLGGIGAGLAYIQHRTAGLGMLNFIRWSIRGEVQKLKPAAIVGLEKWNSYDTNLLAKLDSVWLNGGMPDVRGKRILVKPNLLDQVNDYQAVTSAKLIGAILDLLINHGAQNIVVGDGSAFRRDTRSVLESSRMAVELEKRAVGFVDLNYDELVRVRARDGWIRDAKYLWLPRTAMEADWILSVPKLKTHHWAGVTLSLKNLLGIIPGSRYGWPKNIIHMNGINPTILGLYQSIPAVISLVDGIIGMEGNGPLFGNPVQHGLLAAGSDPLAVDIICAKLMGFDPNTIPHLFGAAWAGIGQSEKVNTRGTPMDELQQHYTAPPKL